MSQFCRRHGAVVVTVLAIFVSAVQGAAAQSGTPAAYPVAPDPGECVVMPAPVEEIVAIMGTPVAGTVDSATPFVPPKGKPAPEETSADVVSTLRQLFACANAGDLLRVASLFTDDFVREFFGGAPREDLIAFLSIPPQPLVEEQKRVIIRFGDVELLPDGRAGVVIVLDEPDDPRTEEPDFVILERVDDRWRVDEIHEDGSAPSTAATGTPAAS